MLRKLLTFAVVLLFSFPLAHADEATKRAKIEEMLTLLNMNRMMNSMMDQSVAQSQQMVKGMLGNQPLSEADQKAIQDFSGKVMSLIRDNFGWEKMKPTYIELYASAYTEEEVDGILAFYRSPVGRSMLAKTPELLAKSMQIASTRMQALQPQMRDLMDGFAKQIAAEHGDKGTKP